MTPLNIAFWGGLYEPAQPILRQVAVNPLEMFLHVFLLLGLPLAIGTFGVALLAGFHCAGAPADEIFSRFSSSCSSCWRRWRRTGNIFCQLCRHGGRRGVRAQRVGAGHGLWPRLARRSARNATGARCRSSAASRTPASASSSYSISSTASAAWRWSRPGGASGISSPGCRWRRSGRSGPHREVRWQNRR